ncbi:MAG: Uma2 family endonuclease [Anaerolineae bacterium]
MSGLRGQLLELLVEPGLTPDELRQRAAAVLEQTDRPLRMSYEEFLAWADEDVRAEWVSGEVIVSSPASDQHQDIVRFLTVILSVYVEVHRLGIIRPAPFQMRLAESSREPDLLFLSNDHLDRRRENYLDGPADVVIEVLSPESAARDRGEKFYEYEAAGIAEYWLIDPQREQAEFYRLGSDGRYRPVLPDAEGRFVSQVIPGFTLRVDWLWRRPAVLDALREQGVV